MTATTETRVAPRLKSRYADDIAPKLREQFGYPNVMQTPRLVKIVVNMGVGEAARDPTLIAGGTSRASGRTRSRTWPRSPGRSRR